MIYQYNAQILFHSVIKIRSIVPNLHTVYCDVLIMSPTRNTGWNRSPSKEIHTADILLRNLVEGGDRH
jgi:hypothetical protein